MYTIQIYIHTVFPVYIHNILFPLIYILYIYIQYILYIHIYTIQHDIAHDIDTTTQYPRTFYGKIYFPVLQAKLLIWFDIMIWSNIT